MLLDILLLHSYLVRQSVSYKHIIHGRVSALPQTCLLLRITLGLIPTSSSQYGSSFASSLSSFAIFAALLVLQQKYEGLTTRSLIGTASNNLCGYSSSLQHFPNHMQYCSSHLQHFLYHIRCCSRPLQLSPGHGPHFSSYQQRYRTAGSSNYAGFDHYYQYHGHYCQIMHIHNRKNVNSSRRMVCRTRTMLTNNSRTNSSLHSRQPRSDFPSDYSHIIASTHLEALLVSTFLVYN